MGGKAGRPLGLREKQGPRSTVSTGAAAVTGRGGGLPFPGERSLKYFNLLKTLSILLINLTLKDWNLHPVLFLKYTNDK